MDTGSIMQNQMDDLIESSHWRKYEQYLHSDILQYIEECKYDWTVDEIVQEYFKYKEGNYISYSSEKVILKFINELDKLYSK